MDAQKAPRDKHNTHKENRCQLDNACISYCVTSAWGETAKGDAKAAKGDAQAAEGERALVRK